MARDRAREQTEQTNAPSLQASEFREQNRITQRARAAENQSTPSGCEKSGRRFGVRAATNGELIRARAIDP